MTRRNKDPRRPLTDNEIRKGYQELVQRRLVRVTKSALDPMKCSYEFTGGADAERMMIDLAALGIATL